MSSSRSLRPWPRRCTTPHEDRRRPGPGGGERVELHGRGLQPVLLKLFEEEPGGGQREAFAEPRPQEQVQRHTMEQLADVAPVVPALGVPESQMVDQLVAALKHVDSSVPDQIIAVPKISLPSRPLRGPCPTQMMEQLVEVPNGRGGLDGDGHGGRGGGAPHLD